MQILNQYQIEQKIHRLAIEILENNLDSQEIILAGINNNGFRFASMLMESIQSRTDKKLTLARIQLNPAEPVLNPVKIDLSPEYLNHKTIIIIDDVANTGRTIFYACKVLMDVLPEKVEVAVLVDRKHKSFPVKVDYVGLSLATTLQENIDAKLANTQQLEVLLN
jgi:pyrimidine operon attenuation protein/uracil phosphoribosyltransferase